MAAPSATPHPVLRPQGSSSLQRDLAGFLWEGPRDAVFIRRSGAERKKGPQLPAPPRHAGEVVALGSLGAAWPNNSKHSPGALPGNARPLLGDPGAVVNRVLVVTHPRRGAEGSQRGLGWALAPRLRRGRRGEQGRRDEGGAQEIKMGRPSHALRAAAP